MTPEEPADYAVASAGIHSAVTADDIDGGFSDEGRRDVDGDRGQPYRFSNRAGRREVMIPDS